jgi:hypothetical protein
MSAPRCYDCGRFCPWTSEVRAPFAFGDVYEPPDDEYVCAKCASDNEEMLVRWGYVTDHWIKPAYERRAAARLGFVEVKLPGSAWTTWAKPDSIPKGYVNA